MKAVYQDKYDRVRLDYNGTHLYITPWFFNHPELMVILDRDLKGKALIALNLIAAAFVGKLNH